jgi:hypothetical protein
VDDSPHQGNPDTPEIGSDISIDVRAFATFRAQSG